MTKEDILKLRDHCEVTKVQFKERITDKYDVGCEMVAFCNSHGGQLVIGINDKTGVMNSLSYQEVQETTHEFVIVFRRKSDQVSDPSSEPSPSFKTLINKGSKGYCEFLFSSKKCSRNFGENRFEKSNI